MNDLVIEFEKTFSNESVTSLAEIWCFLYASIGCPQDNVWPIMAYISGKITLKECLIHWNKNQMTDDEFNDWLANSPHDWFT